MTKEELIKEASAQLEVLKKQLDEAVKNVGELSEEAKKTFDEQKKELEELYNDSIKNYDKYIDLGKDKAEENYNEAKDFVLLTQKALKHSFNYFLSHYKRK